MVKPTQERNKIDGELITGFGEPDKISKEHLKKAEELRLKTHKCNCNEKVSESNCNCELDIAKALTETYRGGYTQGHNDNEVRNTDIKFKLIKEYEQRVKEAEEKGRQGVVSFLKDRLAFERGCTICACPLDTSHFCGKCRERIAVELDYDGFIWWLEKEMKKK